MKALSPALALLIAGVATLVAPLAKAQMAVIDVSAVAQLVRQLSTMEQQLTTLESQLREAQAQYQAMTGDRGMENLLAGVNRNYLPADWPTLMAAATSSSATYPAFSAGIQSNVANNAVLTPQQIAALSPDEQAQLLSDRQNDALLETTVQQALATTSSRFSSLQELIAAIGSAPDAKASLDLQARVAAEQAMVQNDQTKLQVLYEAAQAQAWVQEQRIREQSISGIGSLRTLPAMGL